MASTHDAVDLTSDAGSESERDLGLRSTRHDEYVESEDEDLKRAIALSLADTGHAEETTNPEMTDSGTMGVKSDTWRVVAASHDHRGANGRGRIEDQEASSSSVVTEPGPAAVVPASSATGFLGIDRKAMETERLSRLKRKRDQTDSGARPISPPPVKKATKSASTVLPMHATNPPPSVPKSPASTKSVQVSSSTSNSKTSHGSSSLSRTHPTPPIDPSLPSSPTTDTPTLYPNGTVLRTYSASHTPTTQDISFPSLIHPSSTLQSALLSSFLWDFNWLFPHFSTKTTKFLLVMQGKSPLDRQTIISDFDGISNVRVCFPPMEGNVNCMHSKLMILFWEERCRIVVPTSNLMGFDWGVGGYMENVLWVIDLPAKRVPHRGEYTNPGTGEGRRGDETLNETAQQEEESTAFKSSLVAFLTAQKVPPEVTRKLDRFDFARTMDVGFVHTIGGSHAGNEAWRKTGYCGLGRTVKQMGLESHVPQVDFVTSSVGSLNDEFMRSIYLACQGDDGLTEYRLRTAKASSIKVNHDTGKEWKSNFRFYFPSDETVASSIGGKRNAGTICFSRKWWTNPKFPTKNMRDCISVRQGLLMHNKIIFVRFPGSSRRVLSEDVPEEGCAGWAYIGSANLSESAWGRLVQDKSSKMPRLTCRNWECGVVLPIPADETSTAKDSGGGGGPHDLDIFEGHVPVPMLLPAPSMEGKTPWFFRD